MQITDNSTAKNFSVIIFSLKIRYAKILTPGNFAILRFGWQKFWWDEVSPHGNLSEKKIVWVKNSSRKLPLEYFLQRENLALRNISNAEIYLVEMENVQNLLLHIKFTFFAMIKLFDYILNHKNSVLFVYASVQDT